MPYTYKYPHMAVTVDIVLLTGSVNPSKVLLIKRKNQPFQNYWALPGGYVDIGESVTEAANRELEEETNIEGVKLSFFQYYDAIYRDPRERTLSLAFVGILKNPKTLIQAKDDAAEVSWFDLNSLPSLAFDHSAILADAIRILPADKL